jgi:hypothetical protein
MSQTDVKSFQALTNTTAPAFSSSAMGATSHIYALESTGLREFQWPSNRAVRVHGTPDVPFSIKFGPSTVTAASSDSMLAWGRTREVFTVQPNQTHVAIVSSTTIIVNFTLGQGR